MRHMVYLQAKRQVAEGDLSDAGKENAGSAAPVPGRK
mgnify:FL=1|jgi:hypothetical protein